MAHFNSKTALTAEYDKDHNASLVPLVEFYGSQKGEAHYLPSIPDPVGYDHPGVFLVESKTGAGQCN